MPAPSYTPTATNYVINAYELPANQAAAALFLNQSGINPSGMQIVSSTQTALGWAQSPAGSGVGGGQTSFGDQSIATRKTTAQAALNAENTRLTAQGTTITNAQTAVTNLLLL